MFNIGHQAGAHSWEMVLTSMELRRMIMVPCFFSDKSFRYFSDFLHVVTCAVTGRLNENLIGVPESYSKAAAEACLPSYCALNDPHLREYYQRKFSQPFLTASVSSIRGTKVMTGR